MATAMLRVCTLLIIIWASGRTHGQSIVQGPKNITVPFNGSATFTCIFDAYMGRNRHLWVTPLYEAVDDTTIWLQTKNYELNYDNETNNFTLAILRVTLQDQGEYECQLAAVGTVRAYLNVIGLPVRVQVPDKNGSIYTCWRCYLLLFAIVASRSLVLLIT